jgi:hypothetical protein
MAFASQSTAAIVTARWERHSPASQGCASRVAPAMVKPQFATAAVSERANMKGPLLPGANIAAHCPNYRR